MRNSNSEPRVLNASLNEEFKFKSVKDTSLNEEFKSKCLKDASLNEEFKFKSLKDASLNEEIQFLRSCMRKGEFEYFKEGRL